MIKYLFLIVSFFSCNAFSANYLITYPHSSLHWTLYQFTHLSHEKCVGMPAYRDWKDDRFKVIFTPWEQLRRSNKNRNISFDDIFVFQTHFANKLSEFNILESKDDKLILILRNYKECFSRNVHTHKMMNTKICTDDRSILNYDHRILIEKLFPVFDKYAYVFLNNLIMDNILFENNPRFQNISYFRNLYFFDSYPYKKLLIYYEDLIVNPRLAMNKIFDFLQKDKMRFNEFYVNLDFHKKKSLSLYTHAQGKSFTKGKNLIFHSDNLGVDNCKYIDAFVKKYYPILWRKYLSRFATN
jgi:hypothetical protein